MNKLFKPEIRSAYKNTDLKNIPGERWKEIDGYEGIYMISSYGRIKSLERRVEVYFPKYKRTMIYFTKIKIRKVKVHTRINSVVNKKYFECTVSLKNNRVEKNYLVSRLVYCAFIRKLDFHRDGLMVFHKSANGLVNHYKNLDAGSHSAIIIRSYQLQRQISPFKTKTQHELNRIAKKASLKRQKEVYQCSSNGRKIRKFASIKEASNKTRIPGSNIVRVLKKIRTSAGGFIWIYASRKKVERNAQ